jgi:hypothetical protein
MFRLQRFVDHQHAGELRTGGALGLIGWPGARLVQGRRFYAPTLNANAETCSTQVWKHGLAILQSDGLQRRGVFGVLPDFDDAS